MNSLLFFPIETYAVEVVLRDEELLVGVDDEVVVVVSSSSADIGEGGADFVTSSSKVV